MDTIWPRSVQVQLNAHRAGDVVLIGVGMRGQTENESARITNEDHPYYAFDRLQAASEMPSGEWNRCEIVARGDLLKVTINGVLQNVVSGLSVTRGHLALQSAGRPVEFRKMELRPLDD